MKAPTVKSVRCAIYTRVSTDQGLDQEFNSLDAQYEAASAYIKSQAHAGWTLIRSRYDDGGYSGGSIDRPDLQRLLEDIRARKIDVIVVYKVDRLTRSLADFAKLVELFDAHGVSFVSVTQQFNTTTSMGRLTLNVLLSFAQFEREVTSERIRDKIAASKRKGIWVGGNLPLGYEMKDGKIAVVEEEAELVRSIFRRYLELGSVNELVRDLRERNIRTRIKLLATGAKRGGIPFGRTYARRCSRRIASGATGLFSRCDCEAGRARYLTALAAVSYSHTLAVPFCRKHAPCWRVFGL
jgi:site-specific DNA recombinase